MLDALRKALNAAGPKRHSGSARPPIKGGNVLQAYEEFIRKGERPPAMLVNQVGDMYRDLQKPADAAAKYVESANLYVQEEAWTPSLQMIRKADRMLQSAKLSEPELCIQMGIITVQVELGRGEWHDAASAIVEVGKLLQPADARAIEQLIEVVDAEPTASPEVELELGEVLVMLGRPEIAIERYREALRRATAMGNERLVMDLRARLAQAEAYEPPARRQLRRAPSPRQVELEPSPEPATRASDSRVVTPADNVGTARPSVPVGETIESPEDRREALPAIPSLDDVYRESPTDAESGQSDPDAGPLFPPLEALFVDVAEDLPALDDGAELPDDIVASFASRPLGQDEDPQQARPDSEPPTEAPKVAGAPVSLPDVPLRLVEDEEDDIELPEPAGTPYASATSLEVEQDDDYVQPDMLRAEPDRPCDTRIVGTDARAAAASDNDQVRELVRQLRQGIRDAVPTEEGDTHYELGLSFLQMGLYDDAVESFQTAFRSPELRRRAIEGLTESLLRRGDALLAHRAVRMAREELDEPGQDSIGLLYWQARAAEALGRSEEALELYAQVCLVDVRFADAHDRLAGLTK